SVPDAKGGKAILGHALDYQKDPPAFLLAQESSVGKIFRINLAGRRMIVIGSDKKAMKLVSSLPENTLSARQAVADIGFEYTLGKANVFTGTDWHKRILKDEIICGQKMKTYFVPQMAKELSSVMDKEMSSAGKSMSGGDTILIPDVFVLVRRCVLQAMVNVLIGSCIFLEDSKSKLVEEVMQFQDRVEDATAKAAVLPGLIALPLVLWPCALARRNLQQKLAKQIVASQDTQTGWGPWLRVLNGNGAAPSEIAELIIGLIFAAHKNPAIGASQSFCYLMESKSSKDLASARKEAKQLLSTDKLTLPDLLRALTLRRCVLEATRLTAHTIGAIRLCCAPFDLETEDGKVYKIQAGETLAISHIIPNTAPGDWGQHAWQYDPHRVEWEQLDKQKVASPVNPFKMTSFSQGLHKCPGEQVALITMQIMLALLLDKNLSVPDTIPAVSFERATLAQRSGPVPVTF
ncbi:unnamed protein product, partial [Heterosigma akashiwo]